jgi:hypothetical protein
MSISKSKERALNLTGSTIITTIAFTVQTKDIYFRVKVPDIFSNDRKKFKVYEAQCRIYLWADGKRGK